MEGTLRKAFQDYSTLECPVKKLMYIMFVVTEVHPFVDGNSRIARTMLNVELLSADLERIIIPSCFREDYLLGLRSITKNKNFNAYCRMLDRAQHFTAHFDYIDIEKTKLTFSQLGVYEEGRDARLPELAYRKNMSPLLSRLIRPKHHKITVPSFNFQDFPLIKIHFNKDEQSWERLTFSQDMPQAC